MSKACELCGNDGLMGNCTCLEAECARCDGMGEWEEGPLPARSIVQSDPEYVTVTCPACEGAGWIKCDRGGLNCRYASHDGKTPCYCEQAFDRQQKHLEEA